VRGGDPKGTRNKYEYDPHLGGIKFDRLLMSAATYPTDYGYLRDTLAARPVLEPREKALQCRACPLWAHATQTVFGEGPPRAPIMLVGERPGDSEDRAGQPFVGPAGGVLEQALEHAPRGRCRLAGLVVQPP
jgi:hypothetical protein